MTCVGENPRTMNTKAFQDLRTSDQRTFAYKIDAGMHRKLENKQRVDGVGTEQVTKQFEMEKHLSDSEIRKGQKSIKKKMLFLKHRLDECRERHEAKTKQTLEWEERERERMQKEYEESKKGRGRRDNFVTSKFPAKNKPVEEEPVGAVTKSDEPPKPKRPKADYHYEIIKKAALSEPSAIWSVRRARRTTDQETGRFLYRALTELEKVGEKHHDQYLENIKTLRKLEKQTGMRLDQKGTPDSIKRDAWWTFRPATPVPQSSTFISQLEVKEKALQRTIDKLRQTYPPATSPNIHKYPHKLEPIQATREQALSIPPLNGEQTTPQLGERGKTDSHVMERRVTFAEDNNNRSKTMIATKEDALSRKSIIEIKQIEKVKLEECQARVAHFLNKANPNANLPPPKDKFAKQEIKPTIELPKINVLLLSAEKYKEAEYNPFMEGLELPKISRSRDLLDNSSKEMGAMWAWLGFETKEDFVAAVKGFKKSKKREKEEDEEKGPQSEVLAQLEKAGVDAAQLKKLAQLESMLPDGFNDLDIESDDETEQEVEDEEDPRFALFDKKVVSNKKKKPLQKTKSTVSLKS